MIIQTELLGIAHQRLKDAELLHEAGRFDSAVYLCGYAVELPLKRRICRTLRWTEFPISNREFQLFRSFKTHDLDVLLRLSGVESKVKQHHMAKWSVVAKWDSEVRYKPIGSATQSDSNELLEAARTLLGVL